VLCAYISSDEREYQGDEVRRIQRDLKTGKTRLATDAEVIDLKKKAGV
jgi:hypothetical protein